MATGSIGKYGTLKADKISVSEIDIPGGTVTGLVGTLKLSNNLEIGGDGMILSDLEAFEEDDNGETITYADTSTATATVTVTGTDVTDTLTSSVSKEITTPENITLNSKTFSITQTGTTVTIDQTTTKKIVSLEQGNLVLADYNATTGVRSNPEVLFDSNNSIAEINNAAYNLEVLSLDVTTAATAGTATPTAGNARIDGSIEVNAGITVKNGNFAITPEVITSVSTTIGTPTDLDETKSVLYFDLDSASAMYGELGTATDGLILNIFYDNNNSSGSLRIDFGSANLRTGNGNNQYLTFSNTGESAQLMYISTVTKWCIMNTGAAVS